jgi:molybdopterin converting factor small subunit
MGQSPRGLEAHLAEVSVLYFGPLYEIIGKRREKMHVESDSTLRELLEEMRKKHKRLGGFIFESEGKIRNSIAFAVNGISISKSQLEKIKCGDVSEFVVLPPISGG